MNSRRGSIFIFILVPLAALLAWWLWPRPEAEEVSASGMAAAGQSTNAPGSGARHSLPPPELIPEIIRSMTGERQRQRERDIESARDEWRTPIEFYGKAVDENGQPVEKVAVTFGVTDLSTDGHSTYHATSDANGLFSLRGVRGKHLSIKLHKTGYYVSRGNPAGFFYAGRNDNFIANASQPVLFHLHQYGQAEPLIVWTVTHLISISGRPLHIDRQTGSIVTEGNGDLVMEYKKGNVNPQFGKHHDWSFKISVPQGGVLLSTAEFDFLAPEQSYHPTDEIVMVAEDIDWEGRLNRRYFVKFADGLYARIALDMMLHNGSLRISAYLNPAGSRNLEYSEEAQAQLEGVQRTR